MERDPNTIRGYNVTKDRDSYDIYVDITTDRVKVTPENVNRILINDTPLLARVATYGVRCEAGTPKEWANKKILWIKMLLEMGANPNVSFGRRFTLLGEMILRQHMDAIRLLIDHGATGHDAEDFSYIYDGMFIIGINKDAINSVIVWMKDFVKCRERCRKAAIVVCGMKRTNSQMEAPLEIFKLIGKRVWAMRMMEFQWFKDDE